MGETRNTYKIFVGKPEGKRPLVSYKHRWENNIKMYLEYVGRNLNDFSSICVQTGSGAHPASCTMGTGGPFPGGKSAAGA